MNRFVVFVIVLVLGAYQESMAQKQEAVTSWKSTPNVLVKTFDQSDGLPVLSLSNIALGADGYIYVSSYGGGVSRFNGSTFEQISSEQYPNLPSNRVTHVVASPDSAVWIFDERANLSRWKAGVMTAFGQANGVGGGFRWPFKISDSGSTWIVNKNVIKVLKRDDRFIEIPYPSDSQIIDYIPVNDSTAWIFNLEGLHYYRSGNLEQLVAAKPGSLDRVHNVIAYDQLKFLPDSTLVGVHPEYVLTYHMRSKQSDIYPIETPLNISFLSFRIVDGGFRVNTPLRLYEFNLEKHKPELKKLTTFTDVAKQITPPYANTMYVYNNKVYYNAKPIYDPEVRIITGIYDREDNFWIVTDGNGLQRVSISPFQALTLENGLFSDNVYSVIEDEDQSIWLGTFDAGVNRVTENKITHWSADPSFGNPIVTSLYKSKDRTLFAGLLGRGLRIYNGDKWIQDDLAHEPGVFDKRTVDAYFESENGDFWMGMRTLLVRKPAGSSYFREEFAGDSKVKKAQVIVDDYKKRIWFGTDAFGLFQYDDTLRHVPVFEDTPVLSIRDIFTERPDTLWLATQSKGLVRVLLDQEGNVINKNSISRSDGLADIGVHRILADAYGYFWLPSNQGLSRVHEQSLNRYLDGGLDELWIQNFDEHDGLPNREANGGVQSAGIVASDGTIWVPNQRGVFQFDPAWFLEHNPFEHTEVTVSKIESSDQTYRLYGKDEVRLQATERSLVVNFDKVHYSKPEDINLEYRIQSLQTGWQDLMGNNQLNITNIPPGTHNIEVRLSGIPEEIYQGAVFSFTIPRFFYEEIWFYILMGIGGLGVVGFGFLFMANRSKRREVLLNNMVEERTHQLTEQTKELERLSRAKTDFFINITHELRTPLTLIKGPLGLLKEASNKQHVDRDMQLGLIERNSNKLNSLVDRLLSLLRLETEMQNDKTERIELRKFVQHTAAQYESSEALLGKVMNIHPGNHEAFVDIDSHSLELIMNNLIGNALKYTENGDRIDIYVGQNEEQCSFVEVKDTGIGIDEGDLRYIFDPFYRSKNAEYLEGSGIGLSVVKRYMERIGGRVHIESELNQGTSVWLFFPHTDSTSEVIPNEVEDFISDTSADSRNEPSAIFDEDQTDQRPIVLIVDDNQDLRTFLTSLLSEYYQVRTAVNGADALAVLEKLKPDLILSDIMMPNMDGIELVKNIRLQEDLKFIPIVLFSAKKTNESITEGLQAGAEVYLTKPIDNEILIAQIGALLSREARVVKLNEEIHAAKKSPENLFVMQVDELILRHLSDNNLSIDTLADAMHMSRSTLYRKWKKVSEHNLNDYILQTRLQEAIQFIKEHDCSFEEAAKVCGFNHATYFSRAFKKYYHTTPSKYFKSEEIRNS